MAVSDYLIGEVKNMQTEDELGLTDRKPVSPLLKWPGGKRSLLKKITPLLPTRFNTYYEPFFGGGALFFALQPTAARVSDNNEDLINCYVQVRNNPELVISHLEKLQNCESEYYKIRGTIPTDNVERAARLIYLTTLSFNGIHRQNLKGEFNVPYGHKTHINPCDKEKIYNISRSLSGASITTSDFEQTVNDAGEGDLVYFDPPYTISNGTSGFIKYNSKIFKWDDQVRLSTVATDLVNKGCTVVISNANHPSINELYVNFEKYEVERQSVIAASGEFRGLVKECIYVGGRL